MKTKKYKTAAHKRMYEIEVACKATSRKLMCGAATEAEGVPNEVRRKSTI